MKFLINTPSLNLLAGVANHYLGLKKYWTADVKYHIVGKRTKNGNGMYWLPYDVFTFIIKLICFRPDVVLLNPSMARRAIKRDFIFFHIARTLGFKVAVMFHGFHVDNVKGMEQDITDSLNKACCVFVLANQFKEILRNWGVRVPVELTTTKVDDRLLCSYEQEKRKYKISNILYLGRITKEKGIFIYIETCIYLHKRYPNLNFTVVGDGEDLEKAKAMSKSLGNSIRFTGGLSGEKLVNEFMDADLYLFTSYHEGMPTSVLEAMAFGLPVITRPVGGLVDFFSDEMGMLVDSFDSSDFASAISLFMENEERVKAVSEYNHQYAGEHFLASKVAENMEKLLRNQLKLN